MIRLYASVFCFSMFFGTGTSWAQVGTEDRCRVVAELMARDDSANTLRLKYADLAYDNYCEGQQAKQGIDFSSAGSFFGYGIFGDNQTNASWREEKVKQFCKTHNRQIGLDIYANGTSSTVVRESVRAWQACVTANKDVQIDIESTSPAGFQIKLLRGHENAEFRGLHFHEGQASCLATFPAIGTKIEKTKAVNSKTRFSLDDGQQRVISCTRTSIKDKDGNEFLPQITLDIITNYGSMPVTLAADTRLGAPVYVSQWNAKYQDQKSGYERRVAILEARRPESQIVCNGSHVSHIQDVSYPAACPAGWSERLKRDFVAEGGSHGLGYKCLLCERLTPDISAAPSGAPAAVASNE